MESFRNQDMRAEQCLGEFMDAYFYSKLKNRNGGTISFVRMADREAQLNGIDVCIEVEGKKILIDEKASVYYSNAMIPTFAFELDSIQKGHDEPVQGWFVNDDLRTEYYMLIWPNIKCFKQGDKWIRKDIKNITKDDFTIVEAMLLNKKDLRSMLEKSGYNKMRLVEYARKFRAMYKQSKIKEEQDIIENVKITFSGQLAEQPVNLVIRKELLGSIAKGIYLISADGYASLKG